MYIVVEIMILLTFIKTLQTKYNRYIYNLHIFSVSLFGTIFMQF